MSSVLHGGDRNLSFTYPGDPDSAMALDVSFPILSFQWADYDGWWVSAEVLGTDGQHYHLRYKPDFGQPSVQRINQQITIEYGLGEGSLDNQWHTFGRNLAADLYRMAPGVKLQAVKRLTLNGLRFLDDVMLGQAPVLQDVAPPEVDFRLEGTSADGGATFVLPVRFIALADDNTRGSGVEAVFVRVDGRYWVEDFGQTHVIEETGEHVLEMYAVDKAGNLSDVQSVKVPIDHRQE
jgi:hypothetical protein